MINFNIINDNTQRTDLAVEFSVGRKKSSKSKNIKRTDIKVDAALSKKLNRAVGTYITVESNAVRLGLEDVYIEISHELALALKKLIGTKKTCLVAALGNPNLTADALGKYVADRLIVTRHLKDDKSKASLSCICPNVLGITGIESFDIVKGVANRTHPECIIVVDSLAGASTMRIASAFQVSDAGITPGSGVANHRIRFDEDSLGCKVISIGVPLVVYASTIIADAFNGVQKDYDPDIASLIVTPKDIDMYVEDCAKIVASAINEYCHG